MQSMKIYSLLIISMLICSNGRAQSVEEIKADRATYIWGEGSGTTINNADKEALAIIISQISTYVEDSFIQIKEELLRSGKGDAFQSKCKSIVNTYSSATLNNTERIVISNEPDAKVFRYIKRSEVSKVFAQREEKILQYTKSAIKAEKDLKISDALRYYYWAALLLKSHPYSNDIKINTNEGEQLLNAYLPIAINNVLMGMTFGTKEILTEEEAKFVTINVSYKGKPVTNFDYTYWDGRNWSNIISATDGTGILELFGAAADFKKIQIKAEYIFEGEARSYGRELENVMRNVDHIAFRKAYYNLNIAKIETQASVEEPAPKEEELISLVHNPETYSTPLDKIVKAINTKEFKNIHKLFTKKGYDVFTKLVRYGNARVLESDDIQYFSVNNEIIARSMLMSFDFKYNNKQFIENVNFAFNKKGKINNVTFGLSDLALNSILKKQMWDEKDRLVLVGFLENYKTAYALKRIDFLDTIFAEDALIITGRVVKVKKNADNAYANNRIVRYNKQSKKKYISHLRQSFLSKEYINIKFEESRIRKSGMRGDVYGIQIKQNYYSSNYGDKGFLFLMVDLNNKQEPVIHVRTWQPDINKQNGIYGLSDF